MVDTFTLQVNADEYQGLPQFIIRMDGTKFRDVLTTNALHTVGQAQAFSFSGDFSNVKQISVELINDLYDGTPTQDRNLYVQNLTFDGQTQLGSQAVYIGDCAL